VGIPFVFGNVMGDLDTALFERVDVVRGANGLISSTGNPSATVNFVRKRPTAAWPLRPASPRARGTRAASTPTCPRRSAPMARWRRASSWRTRKAIPTDRYSPRKDVAYAVVEAKLTPDTTLTVGHSYQGSVAGGMWGALPVAYADGTPADYPISTSTSADWSRWSIINNSTFAELAHQFNADWRVTATATDNRSASDSKLFYVYGTPDKATGDGLFSYPSRYASANKQRLLDVGATGAFTLAGRRHDLSMGLAWSKSTLDDVSYYGRGIAAALPNMARRSTAPIRNRCLTHRPMAAPTRTNARTPARPPASTGRNAGCWPASTPSRPTARAARMASARPVAKRPATWAGLRHRPPCFGLRQLRRSSPQSSIDRTGQTRRRPPARA
jgi:outer membrane receptor for ferric coprogen and ferric-rhodotorulic acid